MAIVTELWYNLQNLQMKESYSLFIYFVFKKIQ